MNENKVFDENDAIKFIREYIPENIKNKYSDNDILLLMDTMYDFFDEEDDDDFDEENFDNVKLEDNSGTEIEFEQIAVVDYEEKYYAILHPVTEMEGISEDEALVFLIDEEKDELIYCEDESTAQAVFAVYYEDIENQE